MTEFKATQSELDCSQLQGDPAGRHAYLDHEVLDAAVELGSGVVAHGTQGKEVFASPGNDVAVQLQVEVSQVCADTHVPVENMGTKGQGTRGLGGK